MVGADWKTMNEFAAGIDANRLPATAALAGRNLTVRFGDGTALRLAFRGDGTATWGGPGEESGTDWYEAVEVRPGVYFLDQTFAAAPYRSVTTMLNTATGRALVVTSRIADEPVAGVPRVSQDFAPGVIEGAPPGAPAPAESRDLVGWRALYRYSPHHLYEHVYLSSRRYAWQCLVGEQRGHGDVDLSAAWSLGDDLYVFTWREFRIPVAAVWLYDLHAMRTTGKFFGLGGDGRAHNSPGGAYVTSLGRVEYPPDGEPV
ncbi:MAG TPA: molybdenum cofactor biosynthesis F family protein [Streptosporangiaceae bacterium]|jgi:hypothetical protein